MDQEPLQPVKQGQLLATGVKLHHYITRFGHNFGVGDRDLSAVRSHSHAFKK